MQSGFRAHGRVSLSPLPRQAGNLCRLRRPLYAWIADGRGPSSVFPPSAERPGSLFFTQLLFDIKRRSLYRGHDAQGLSFVSPDSMSLYPVPRSLLSCHPLPSSLSLLVRGVLVPPTSFLPRGPYPSLFPLLLLSPC